MTETSLSTVLHSATDRVTALFGDTPAKPPEPVAAAAPNPDIGLVAKVGQAIATQIADAAPAPYRAKATSLWRRLDEERQHHIELAAEFDAEIAAITAKRDDALQAAAMAEAGMSVADVAP